MLNYNHLYYFHLAATEGSLTAAAEHLGVGLSTVSEQIRLLERALGVVLFERTSSGMRLTAAGQQAHEHTSTMFRAGERLAEALGRSLKRAPLMLHVGLTPSISRTLAADFLMPVLAVPDCVPTIRTGGFADLLRDLRGHELDLVLCDTEPVVPARRGLEMTTLHRPRLAAIGNPELAPSPTWDDIKLIQYLPGSPHRWEIDHALEERALRPDVAGESDDAFFMLEAVIRGGFVAFVPKSVARDALAARRIKVLFDLDGGTGAVHALFHSGDSAAVARRAVQLLADYAVSALDGS